MLTGKYNFRISDTMAIPLRPNWISNNAYREKCKMLILNRSKGDFHKVDFSKIIDYIKVLVGQRFIYIRAINLKWLTAC